MQHKWMHEGRMFKQQHSNPVNNSASNTSESIKNNNPFQILTDPVNEEGNDYDEELREVVKEMKIKESKKDQQIKNCIKCVIQ